MIKTASQFYRLISIVALILGVALALALFSGDSAGRNLKVNFSYGLAETGGLQQLSLTFEANTVPNQLAAESAFELTPPQNGDFSWSGTTLRFTPAARLRPDTDYRVSLRGGVKLAEGGRALFQAKEWTFRTAPAQIAFLKKEGSAVNLWVAELAGSSPRPLTQERERQVLDFSVSPGADRIVFSLQETNGREVSLWVVKLTGESSPIKLVSEPNIKATAPRWSPGGDLIVYERRLVFESGSFSPAQLWMIKPDGTYLPPLYGGSERVGVGAAWAAGGDKAFFWEPKREALGVFNFTDEPAWKPMPGLKLETLAPSQDGRELVLARFDYSGAQEKEVLQRFSLVGGNWQVSEIQLPAVAGYNDRQPVWSPDGKLVAFLRQEMSPSSKRSSRIWLFDTKSGKSWPLLSNEATEINHGFLQWSPDGDSLIYERYIAGTRTDSPVSEIWQVAKSGENARKLASGVYSPRWVG